PPLAHPAALFHQDAVHHRDLAGGATEAERRDLRPDEQRLAEGNAMGGAADGRGDGAHRVDARLTMRPGPRSSASSWAHPALATLGIATPAATAGRSSRGPVTPAMAAQPRRRAAVAGSRAVASMPPPARWAHRGRAWTGA